MVFKNKRLGFFVYTFLLDINAILITMVLLALAFSENNV